MKPLPKPVGLNEDFCQGLTVRQSRAVSALLQGLNYKDAAKQAEVSLSSIKRWAVLPQFKAAIAAGKRQAVETAVYELGEGCSLAITTLKELMISADSEHVKCRAAEVVLNNTMKVFETGALLDKISHLEALINEP